jgi:DNA polymerase-3 subunit delta
MAKALPASEFLAQTTAEPCAPVCAVFGGDSFLKRQVAIRLRDQILGTDEADFSLTTCPGDTAAWRDVQEELTTVAMFGGGGRLVIVEDADEFVTRFRTQLEDYVQRPSRTAVLVLILDSFPSNTRLYKGVAASGWLIDCSVPTGARLTRWTTDWAAQTHKLKLAGAAAELLVEIIGPELGLIDQELAKLALVAGPDRKVSAEMVTQMSAGWRAKTTWVMLDAALDGNAAEALAQLDRLLSGGETPVGLLAQISASLRRLAGATRMVLQSEAAGGPRISVRFALEQAGIRAFVLQKSERELRRLGRPRAQRLYRWLLEADLDLKGASSLPPRLVLERLVLRLAAPPATAKLSDS